MDEVLTPLRGSWVHTCEINTICPRANVNKKEPCGLSSKDLELISSFCCKKVVIQIWSSRTCLHFNFCNVFESSSFFKHVSYSYYNPKVRYLHAFKC